MNPFGVGLIGCGEIAELHARALEKNDGAKVVATYDRNAPLAESLGRKNNARVYSSLPELLSDPAVQIVYVLTRHNSHPEIIHQSLAAGKHVFSEKPLALNLEAAEMIKAAVRQSGKFLMVGFNHRWNPAVRWVYDKLNSTGEKIRSLNITFVTTHFLHTWAGLTEEGGGVLQCLGSHAVDLACTLLGDSPTHLAAFTSRQRLQDPYLPDTASVIFYMPGGALANLSFHDHAAPSYPSYGTGDISHLMRVEVFTTGWTAVVENSHHISFFKNAAIEKVELETKDPLEVLGIQQENDYFVQCLKANTPPKPNEVDGIRAVQLLGLAEQASKSWNVQVVSPTWTQ